MNEALTQTHRSTLLELARTQVEMYIRSGQRLTLANDDARLDDRLRAPGAAFVTLRNRGALRGCIGSVAAHEPLYENVIHNAVQACCDPRFTARPVTSDELANVDLEISVLSAPQRVAGPDDVVVGRDGVILTVGANRGLFLPQVPVEQKWDRDQYLAQLGRKAGLGLDAYRDPAAVLETFTAEVFGEHEYA
jgi:AmmeMemoRadiSam system protein A